MSPAELAAKRQRLESEKAKSLVDLDSTKSPNDKRQYRVVKLDNGIEGVVRGVLGGYPLVTRDRVKQFSSVYCCCGIC